jgi:hypothetical protein
MDDDGFPPHLPVAVVEGSVVMFFGRVVFFIEVFKRGDLLKCGRFDHIRQFRNACRKQDFAAAKRGAELIVQPPYLGDLVRRLNVHCSLHNQRSGMKRSAVKTALAFILSPETGSYVALR